DADSLATELAPAEVKQRWDTLDVEARGERGILVDVYLADGGAALVLAGNFVQHWREHLARPAPIGPEIHNERPLGLQHFTVEARLVQFHGQFHSVLEMRLLALAQSRATPRAAHQDPVAW